MVKRNEPLHRTGKLRETYDRETGEWLTVGTCPFCKNTTKVRDEDDIVSKCEHFHSMRWGCGGAVFYYTSEAAA